MSLKLALMTSPTPAAEEAAVILRARYDWVPVAEADVVVALGGDGFLLQVLHAALNARAPKPMFGMNLGTVGFMMNEFRAEDLIERVAAARAF